MISEGIDFQKQLLKAIVTHVGPSCEAAIFDFRSGSYSNSISAIENGGLTGRDIGDSPCTSMMELLTTYQDTLEDSITQIRKTEDDRIFKSSAVFERDKSGKLIGMLAINSDLTVALAAQNMLQLYVSIPDEPVRQPTSPVNISDLLDQLIEKSILQIGKPPALMNKTEKMKAIQYLNDRGTFLISKSGPRVCSRFNISKYTLYNYLDKLKNE